jgi:prepilin peptidase CpaA
MFSVLRTVLILVLLAVSVYTDQKSGKVLNKITFPAMFCGIILACFDNGVKGLADSLAGMGIGLALFIIPFIMGLLGAGDVKLLMAVGALLGPNMTFQSFLFHILSVDSRHRGCYQRQ